MTPLAQSLRTFALALVPALALLLSACANLSNAPGTGKSAQAVEPTAEAASAPAAPASANERGVASTVTAPQQPGQEAAGAPVDPLRPEVEIKLDDRSAQIDLWERVRHGFAMPVLDGDLVRTHEQWYATRPDYVQRMTERGSRYLYYIVDELEKRGLPTELALLPFIESAFNPQALSVAKASGMWQFMPGTGRDYELKQNIFRDDRRSVLASTRAALDYLTRLHDMFGDWHLALAAYNWGEGNVQRAIARNQKDGLPTDYESLRMPAETRSYVPKLQAVKNIVSRPDDFRIALPPLANHPYFLAVPIERDIDVTLAATLAGLTSDEFKSLNPQMNKPVILAAGTPQVLLPYDNANAFVRNLGNHRGPLASWTAWIAPNTLKPADAARQVGMSESELREVNRIPPRMLVKAGSTLLVPRNGHGGGDVPEHVAENAAMLLTPDVPPLKQVAFKAGRKGETVATVARRYRVSAAQVAEWNKVSSTARFAPGSAIVVFVPNKGAGVRAASAAAPTKSTTRTAAPASAKKAVAKSKAKAKTAVAAERPKKTAAGGGSSSRALGVSDTRSTAARR